MRMKLPANVLNGPFHRLATDLAFLNLAGAAVNDVVPQRFHVSFDRVVKAADQLARKVRSVLDWQRQNFSNFFSGHTHAYIISCLPAD